MSKKGTFHWAIEQLFSSKGKSVRRSGWCNKDCVLFVYDKDDKVYLESFSMQECIKYEVNRSDYIATDWEVYDES